MGRGDRRARGVGSNREAAHRAARRRRGGVACVLPAARAMGEGRGGPLDSGTAAGRAAARGRSRRDRALRPRTAARALPPRPRGRARRGPVVVRRSGRGRAGRRRIAPRVRSVQVSIQTLLIVGGAIAAIRLMLLVPASSLAARISADAQAMIRERLVQAFLRASWSVKSADREGRFQELMTNQASGDGRCHTDDLRHDVSVLVRRPRRISACREPGGRRDRRSRLRALCSPRCAR